MNVICTDKDGKVIEDIKVDENNPVLINKVNIPKNTTKPTQNDSSKAGKSGTDPNSKPDDKRPNNKKQKSKQSDASTQRQL